MGGVWDGGGGKETDDVAAFKPTTAHDVVT